MPRVNHAPFFWFQVILKLVLINKIQQNTLNSVNYDKKYDKWSRSTEQLIRQQTKPSKLTPFFKFNFYSFLLKFFLIGW